MKSFLLQLVHLYYTICFALAISTAMTLSLTIFSTFWEGSSLNITHAKTNLPTGVKLTEYLDGKLVLVHRLNEDKRHNVNKWQNNPEEWRNNPEDWQNNLVEWQNNPDVLATTHSGLWSTCLTVTGE